MKIIIINGPNLNLLGKREPKIYGSTSFDSYFQNLKMKFPSIQLEYYQSNVEGLLIDKLQEIGFSYDGIILNAGAYTHTSIAIQDTISSISTPVIEIHISNIHSREKFRHHSFISSVCAGLIVGFGLDGYRLALDYFLNKR